MIFFTSDTHFCHKLMAEMRGFKVTEELNGAVIKSWNSCVGRRDIVYHLGDFGFKHESLAHMRHCLNGKIILIRGNHDLKNKVHNLSLWTDVCDLRTIKVDKTPIVLCHYPMRTWDRSHYNSFHMYGHVHSGLHTSSHEIYGKSFDVGWDLWRRPIEWSEAKSYFDRLPDNVNLRRK